MSALRELNMVSMLLRLILAMMSGGLIGLERERKNRPAGLRTYMLVSLGAALTVLFSQYEYTMLTTTWSSTAELVGIKTDVSRFSAQVINGIGFLGAGTILVTGKKQVKGLTTAAGLWASACMGISVGAGFYECLMFAFPMIFLCMRIFPWVDSIVLEKSRDMILYVEFDSVDRIPGFLAYIKSQKAEIFDVEIERSQRKKNLLYSNATIAMRLQKNQTHSQMMSLISEFDGLLLAEET